MAESYNNLGFLIADSARLLRRAFQNKLQNSDLTFAQARALIYTARNEGLRQVDLADLLEVQPITLARLLDQLTEQGLIERRADPNDRRAFLIYLTAAATPHLLAIKHAGEQIRDVALQGLSDEQAQQFMHLLGLVREQLNRL